MSWRDSAACKGHPTDWWYSTHKSEAAKAICADCPVKAECLADALENREVYGIRAGLTMGHVHRRGDATRVPCGHCGELFLRSNRGARIYCSRDCSVQASMLRDSRRPVERRSRRTTRCRWCDEPITGGPYVAAGFCCWSCHRSDEKARTRKVLA